MIDKCIFSQAAGVAKKVIVLVNSLYLYTMTQSIILVHNDLILLLRGFLTCLARAGLVVHTGAD